MKRSLMKIFGNSKKELKVLYDAGQEEAFTKCWTTFSRVSCSLLRNKRPSTFHPNFCLEELGSVFFMSLDFTALTQSISINSENVLPNTILFSWLLFRANSRAQKCFLECTRITTVWNSLHLHLYSLQSVLARKVFKKMFLILQNFPIFFVSN